MKLPQRANHKTMSGDNLLKKAVAKLFAPKEIGLNESYKQGLEQNYATYQKRKEDHGRNEKGVWKEKG